MLYERHLRMGVAAQAFLIAFACVGILAGFEGLAPVSPAFIFSAVGLALPITMFGAVMPDLDEPNSHVYRWFRPFAAQCAAFYVFILLYSSRGMLIVAIRIYIRTASSGYLAGLATMSLAVLTYIVSYRIITRLLDKLTHRNLFHQLPTGLCAGLVLYAEFVPFLMAVNAPRPSVTASVFTVAFLLGCISHLAADGLLLRRQTYIGKNLDEKIDL